MVPHRFRVWVTHALACPPFSVLLPAAVAVGLAWGLMGWVVSGPVVIGNDFVFVSRAFPTAYWFFSRLGLPLHWFPHMEGGVPASYLTQAQPFHLPAWLLAQLPAFWSREQLGLMGAKSVLLFAWVHGYTFHSFRRLAPDLPAGPAFVVALALTYGLRALDAVRFGPFWDAMAYAHCLCLAFVLYLSEGKRSSCVALVAFTQLLFTAGYPTMIAFAGILLPIGGAAFAVSQRLDLRLTARRSAVTLTAVLLGVGLAAPHWLPYFDFLEVNWRRSLGSSLAWASAFAFHAPTQILANLAAPWRAEVHSAFAGSALLSMLLLGSALFAASTFRRNGLWLAALVGLVLFAAGRSTPVHEFFYSHVPGFRFFRNPGRVFSVLPPFLFLGVVCFWRQRTEFPVRARAASIGALLLLAGLSVWGLTGVADPRGPNYVVEAVNPDWTTEVRLAWLWGTLAATVLAAIGLSGRRWAVAGLGVLALAQTGFLLRHGTWIQKRPTAGASFEAIRQHPSFLPLAPKMPFLWINRLWPAGGAATSKMTSFVKYSGKATSCVLPFGRPKGESEASEGPSLPWYLTSSAECVSSWERSALAEWKGDVCGPPPIFVRSASALCSALGDRRLVDLNRGNRVLAVTPNLLRVEVDTPSAALLVSPYPNVPRWAVELDGARAEPAEVNGGLIGVAVPPGRHEVRFSYFSPRQALGSFLFWLTCLGAALVGIERKKWLARGPFRGAWSRTVLMAVPVAVLLALLPAHLAHSKRTAEQELEFPDDYGRRLARQLESWLERERMTALARAGGEGEWTDR